MSLIGMWNNVFFKHWSTTPTIEVLQHVRRYIWLPLMFVCLWFFLFDATTVAELGYAWSPSRCPVCCANVYEHMSWCPFWLMIVMASDKFVTFWIVFKIRKQKVMCSFGHISRDWCCWWFLFLCLFRSWYCISEIVWILIGAKLWLLPDEVCLLRSW
jgi:hypothetical protein